MKAKFFLISMVIFGGVLFSSNAKAETTGKLRILYGGGKVFEIAIKAESFINDLPFDTKKVVESLRKEQKRACSTLTYNDFKHLTKAEAEVDDIPFDTRAIFAKAKEEDKMARK